MGGETAVKLLDNFTNLYINFLYKFIKFIILV